MAYASDIRIAGTSIIDRLVALRDTVKARHAQYRVYRTTLAELENLSARDLSDLGICRTNINAIAYAAAYK